MIQRKDYILRLVEDFGAFLRKVFALKQDDKTAAEQLVDTAVAQITGLRLSLFLMLDFESGLRMIERGRTLSAYECAVIANLLIEKADLSGVADFSKARSFLALAKQRDDGLDGELRTLIAGLEAKLTSAA